MTGRRPVLAVVALLLGAVLTAPAAAGEGAPERGQDQVARVREYRVALRRALIEQTREVDRVEELVDRLRERYERAPRLLRRLAEAQGELETLRATRDATRRRLLLTDAALEDLLVSWLPASLEDRVRPVRAVPIPPAVRRVKATLVRYDGPAAWSLARTAALESYFRRRFGRALPVSAFGQTPLHDRLGFDHHDAVDVALHPDSREGAALLAFLRERGFPFIAVRGPVEGWATGPHIHVGAPSARIAE